MEVSKNSVPTKATSIVDTIYRPIWRGYFAAFALYYLCVLPTHFLDYTSTDRALMVCLASAAACTGLWGFWQLGRDDNQTRIEPLMLFMNGLIVLNVFVALNINFLPEKLLYFLILAMAFALGCSTFRQALISISLAAAAMVTFMSHAPQQMFIIYAFLTFGATIASLSIAFVLRRAIRQIATAKVNAEKELGKIAKAKCHVENELTSARQAREKMRMRSLSDSLTGLPNRRAFFDEIENVRRSLSDDRDGAEAQKSAWLLLIDLDGFKAVNDTHGHLVGDQLLQSVAGRLRDFDAPNLFVSRMAGDEFNLIVETDGSEGAIESLCEALLAALSKDYMIAARRVRVSASIGCKAIDPANPVRSDIRLTDFVLRVAKNQGKNRYIIFDKNHAESADNRHKIENALREADFERELHLAFQAQHDLRTGKIVRAEALLRWCSPIVGEVGPDKFIEIAEESGLIGDLTLSVIEKALSAMRSWSAPVPLSINLSCHDVISDVMIEQIMACVETMEINPELIELEVTETAMLADLEKASRNLKRLSDAGFSIALDDFGTGYSNFNYLRQLPITKLKIDRSFLENPGDPMTEKILFSLAGMARTLGVQCLLEGVEDEVDLLIAKRVGAETVQGFHFGKPMSEGELLQAFHNQEEAAARVQPIERMTQLNLV
jgi:diguanylate cyclase (GGDEF)-like protein